VERSKPEPDNVPNDASHDADEQPTTHPKGSPREDHRWLRSVVDNSSEIVTIVDPDGTLRYASPAFGRVLGHDPEEAVGTMNVLDLVHLDDLPHVLEETEAALSKGGVVTNKAEYRFRHRDSSWRWMESVGTYLLDDPHVNGVVVTSRDVTERKEAEEALRRSEAEIFGILESITDAFFSLDREWRFAYVNPQAEVLLNRKREDLVGERIPKDPTFYPQYRRAVAEGRTVRFEGYYSPHQKWYSVRAYPSESGLSVYFQDVTAAKRAEERIRFQARLLDAVGEAVIAIDMEGRGLYWNWPAEEMYGWSSEEARGRHIREMIVPKSLQGRAEGIGTQLREGRNWTGEFVVQRKDGTTFRVEAINTPLFNEDGEFIGAIGVFRDITERKEVEQALRESEQRFKNSFRDASIGMALVGTDGCWLQVNRSLCKILGYPEEELLEKTVQDITHPDDLEADLDYMYRLLAGEIQTYQMEKRYLHKEGHVVWILLSVSLVRDEEGDPLYFVSQIQDVTESKRAEGRLRQAEARYRMLVERMPAVVYIQEIGGPDSAMYMSPQIELLTGYSPEECKDPDLRWLMVHPDDREWMQLEDERAVEPGEVVTTEYRVVHRDGWTVWVRNESVVVEEESGSRYWQGFMVDITERKRAEQRLHHQAHHDLLTDLTQPPAVLRTPRAGPQAH
jgi:PAS domain S-box-containing protein